MSDTEWAVFAKVISRDARARLFAYFEAFCDVGCNDMDPGWFSWLSPAAQLAGAARQGAFQAHGVVVRGRAGKIGRKPIFFVTSIDEDPREPETKKKRSRAGPPSKQGWLPLTITTARDE